MSKGHITAYHPTKGARRFSLGIWAAMGPDKQGFTERAPMPKELEPTTEEANAELREMHQNGEVNATTDKEVAAVMETAIERAAAKKGRKTKAI